MLNVIVESCQVFRHVFTRYQAHVQETRSLAWQTRRRRLLPPLQPTDWYTISAGLWRVSTAPTASGPACPALSSLTPPTASGPAQPARLLGTLQPNSAHCERSGPASSAIFSLTPPNASGPACSPLSSLTPPSSSGPAYSGFSGVPDSRLARPGPVSPCYDNDVISAPAQSVVSLQPHTSLIYRCDITVATSTSDLLNMLICEDTSPEEDIMIASGYPQPTSPSPPFRPSRNVEMHAIKWTPNHCNWPGPAQPGPVFPTSVGSWEDCAGPVWVESTRAGVLAVGWYPFYRMRFDRI
ncbi:hypothetical protein J6590_013078 [Homalodisca vitripennis]|nr:hypothetical protein J6590_013078 [Homalodisca vitripennis]